MWEKHPQNAETIKAIAKLENIRVEYIFVPACVKYKAFTHFFFYKQRWNLFHFISL